MGIAERDVGDGDSEEESGRMKVFTDTVLKDIQTAGERGQEDPQRRRKQPTGRNLLK